MGKFLKRENSFPVRFAKDFCWEILAAVSVEDAFEVRCMPGRERDYHQEGLRGLSMPGFGRTSPGQALMVSGAG
jgi:hypothetical protein